MPERRLSAFHGIWLALSLAVALSMPGLARAQSGSILGQLFTAEHPDSVAAGAQLTLIFRGSGGEVERIPATAGAQGEYSFDGLSTDPEVQYVVRVSYFGRDFLGAPIQFEPGQTSLAYNFLVARDAAPIPSTGMAGHPPVGSAGATGMPPQPVRQDPTVMAVIVLTLLALFGLPVARAYRNDRRSAGRQTEDPETAALVRDIASLDLRFSRQELDAADYDAVRRSLLRRLRQLTGLGDGSA